MNYKLVKAEDGIVWVSVQPLRDDIINTLKHLVTVESKDLSDTDKDIMEFNIMGMKAIATFLDALVKESNEKNTDRQTTH